MFCTRPNKFFVGLTKNKNDFTIQYNLHNVANERLRFWKQVPNPVKLALAQTFSSKILNLNETKYVLLFMVLAVGVLNIYHHTLHPT